MGIRSQLRRGLGPALRKHPALWKRLITVDTELDKLRYSAANALPVLIRPEPRHMEIAITALCNLRCMGCRYGRDFMTGHELPWSVVRDLLDDAKSLGLWDIRLYGGEPLLHRDVVRMVEHSIGLGLVTHV